MGAGLEPVFHGPETISNPFRGDAKQDDGERHGGEDEKSRSPECRPLQVRGSEGHAGRDQALHQVEEGERPRGQGDDGEDVERPGEGDELCRNLGDAADQAAL